MTVLRWEDPPRANTSWKDTATELHAYPGRWACVLDPAPEHAANTAYRQLRKWGCEAVIRKVNTKGHGVWARWPDRQNRSNDSQFGANNPSVASRRIGG